MPIYITRGNYNAETIKNMVAKPEDRTEVINKLFAAVGGKLHGLYYTLGEYDFLVISEAPSEKRAAAALLAVAATGTVSNLNTTVAWSAADMKGALTKAGSIAASFRPAGK